MRATDLQVRAGPEPAAQSATDVTEVHGYCALCKSKCGIISLVKDGRLIAVRPDRAHANHGFCLKGASAPEIVHNAGRLKYPMRRTNPRGAADPGWVRITWDEALTSIVDELQALAARFGPESIAFTRPAPGGSHATDWASYVERLAEAFGSPNTITTGHICNWGRESGAAYTYGTGLPTPQFELARTILIWGHNPANSHIQNWWRIREAQHRGARLVVVDPRRTGTTAKADLWIRPRPGTDTALLLGVIRLLLEQNLLDKRFLADWTNGPFLVNNATGRFVRGSDLSDDGSPHQYVVWDRTRAQAVAVDVAAHPSRWGVTPELDVALELCARDGSHLQVRSALSLVIERTARYDPETVARLTDVPPDQVRSLAAAIGANGPLCYYTYNGVEQHVDTAQISRALGIMYALTGWLEAEGGNVSIGRDNGGRRARPAPAPDEPKRPRIGLSERPLGAAKRSAQAYNFYAAVLTGDPYPMRGLVAFGGNMLLQNGDSARGRRALEQLDFYVHMDLFENPTARFADILLPAASSWETPMLSTSFAGGLATASYAQFRPAAIPSQWESRSDIEVIFDLARRLGLGEHFSGGSVTAAFEAQAARLNTSLSEIQAHPSGVHIPIDQVYRGYAQTDDQGHVRGFRTPTRKVELYSEQFLEHGYDPLPDVPVAQPDAADFPLILTSHKLLQYNHSQGRGIPALRKQVPEPYVEIHPETAQGLGVLDRDLVHIRTSTGSIRVIARLTDTVARGVVATQTGWWEACEELGLPGYDPFSQDGANVNLIMTNDLLDPISGSVPVKSYPCRIEPIHRPDTARE